MVGGESAAMALSIDAIDMVEPALTVKNAAKLAVYAEMTTRMMNARTIW